MEFSHDPLTQDESSLLPDPLDLGAIRKLLHKSDNADTSDVIMAVVDNPNYTVSDRKFGSLWNFKQHGLIAFNSFNNYADVEVDLVEVSSPVFSPHPRDQPLFGLLGDQALNELHDFC